MRVAWRRSRADLWPLVVTLLVVALTVGVTDAVPRLLGDRADTAVRAAVADADPAADLVVTSRYGAGASDPRVGPEDTRIGVDDAARGIEAALPSALQPVLGAPVADATSSDLTLSTPDLPTGGILWMSYLWAGQEPAVRWLAGSAPGRPGPDGAVQLALSDEVSRILGVGAGGTFQALMADRTAVPVLVTGVFDAQDPDDAVWTARPEILRPRVVGPPDAPTTVVGGLLSAASLPAARAALEPDGVTRTFRFPVEPEALDYAGSGGLATQVAALEASPQLTTVPGPGASVTSRLDLVLTQARARVAATWSQATVVLAGLGWGTGLVLLVGADLLARRRSAALRTVRARGASLPGIAAGAAAEAAVVVGAGAAVGLVLAQVVAPGAVSWPWVAVVAVGVVAPAAFATVTAARSDARRVPTDRHHRRLAQRVRSVRRVSVEAALVVLAAAALVALRRRGVVSISGPADLALAAAPVLVAAAGALLLWRAVPVLLRGALRVARRSRKAAPLLAVARAGATGAVLPFVALVVVTTLVALCGALASTARAGQAEGSWDTVGADVVVRTTVPDGSLQDVADRLAAAGGVDAVAVARVQERSELFDVRDVEAVRVLAVDPGPYGELLAGTPFGASAAFAVLGDATPRAVTGPLPALVPEPLLGTRPSLRWGSVTIELQPVGQVPALPAQQADGTPAGPTVVVDRAALAAAVQALAAARAERTGTQQVGTEPPEVEPNTVWAVGPEASAMADQAAPAVRGHVLARAQWLTDRRSDPLAGGLLALLALVAALCAGYATVIVVLAAAASAPGRATSLATARVLGLRHRATTRVAAGELLPSVLVAAAGGVLLGMVLVGALVAPLALRLVTGQSADPGVVLPWWTVVPVGLVGVAVLVVVTVESSARRRERLGQVLRVR